MSRVEPFPPAISWANFRGWARASAVIDRVGLGLAVAFAGWTLVAALSMGGRPWGPVALVAAAMLSFGLARLMASRYQPLVPAAVAVAGLAVSVFLPGEVFTARAVTPVLGYANSKAAFFVLACAAALMLARGTAPRLLRVSAAVVAGVFAVVPFVTEARAAILALAAVLLAAVATARRTSMRLVSMVAAVLFLAVLAVTVAIAGAPQGDGLPELLGERRVALWGEAFDLMVADPVVGGGPGRFGTESPIARSDPDARSAHHSFLQHGAETGIPGFVLLVSLFLWVLLRLTTEGDSRGHELAAAGIVALGLLACFDSLLHFPLLPITTAALVGSAVPLSGRDRLWRPGAGVRKAAKGAVLPWGMVRRRRAGDVVILLYHRVGAGDREIDVPLDLFRRQMERLAERERVLTLDRSLSDGGGVVVTFDDGFADFHNHVLPVLVEHRIPAVLYLATGLVGEGPDALEWSQLEEAVSTGLVTIGSHTHSHADLSRATGGEAEDEMRRSKHLIEDRLGVACRHFAYPWAVASQAAETAARKHFESAALDAWRTNRRDRTDPYRLGRTPIFRSDGIRFFVAKSRGMLDAERILYRVMRRGPWERSSNDA